MFRITLPLILLASSCSPRPVNVVVGSKNFSENVFLAELAAQRLEQAGIAVERRLNLGGTFVCHEALVAGQIDLYPEYTGTALLAVLEETAVSDPDEALRVVRREYADRFGVRWLPPLGFSNTFAILVRDSESAELTSISDLAALTDIYRIGFNFEFEQREDGFAGLQQAYGFEWRTEPTTLDLSLVYKALAERQIDVAVGNSTHGLIQALELRILDDDRRYFPPYDAALVVRQEALDRHPEIGPALRPLTGAITQEKMTAVNRRLDILQERAADVARDVLEQSF